MFTEYYRHKIKDLKNITEGQESKCISTSPHIADGDAIGSLTPWHCPLRFVHEVVEGRASRLLPAFYFSNNVTDRDEIMSVWAYVENRLASLVVSRLTPKPHFFSKQTVIGVNFLAPELFFFNFSTPCI